jgi:hypothetical protein
MSVLPVGIGSSGGYTISRSVRTRSSASAYFNRTPASASNRTTWTWSGWVKRGSLSLDMTLFQGYSDANNYTSIILESANRIQIQNRVAGTATFNWVTTPVYRDPSAWYHIVVIFDTTQATSTNRIALYVNGVQITTFSTQTTGAQNATGFVNNNNSHNIGRSGAATQYFDGYLTEINFIDGQALTASSFGETDTTTGVWKPKQYTGTYGTNGFYLNFSDNSATTATTIGKDNSSNGNNWTPNNISIAAGATYDSMLDVPTPYADGGNGRGNYCVLNPLTKNGTAGTFSSGNLNITVAADSSNVGTIGFSSGKFYFEATVTAATENSPIVGIVDPRFTQILFTNAGTYIGYGYVGTANKGSNGSYSSYGATYTVNDVIGVAVDLDAGTLVFYKNGTSQGTAYTGISGTYVPAVGNGNSGSTKGFAVNFGQRPFSYTPPTGYKALNTQNLPDATIKKGNQYFDATTYTGNTTSQGVSLAVTNSGSMRPDFVWIKNRSTAYSHVLFDAIRGAAGNKELATNATNAEGATNSTQYGYVSAFNSSGFTVTSGTDGAIPGAYTNINGQSYVGWQWNAGGSTVTNTSGSISSQVRANPTAGFSIATFTSTGASATVGHGLGVAPNMLILKSRSNTSGWQVYHSSVGNTGALNLQTTGATSTSIDWWRNTSPTSSVFTIGANFPNAYTWVAYCFAEVAGYSKFGSYTGNGSADGPFIYCGFRPKFVLYKRTNAVSNWFIDDSSRSGYNVITSDLLAEATNVESSYNGGIDFLSNGFKQKATANGNASGGTYIFMAFAENPFKHSLAR